MFNYIIKIYKKSNIIKNVCFFKLFNLISEASLHIKIIY